MNAKAELKRIIERVRADAQEHLAMARDLDREAKVLECMLARSDKLCEQVLTQLRRDCPELRPSMELS